MNHSTLNGSDHSASSGKSLEILHLLAKHPNLSQRDISQASGLSLGMVNLVLRRLAKTGFLKITSLDGRKMRYLLTSKGLTNKSNRTYDYVRRSIRTYNHLLIQVEHIITAQIAQGKTHFVVEGTGEIADLVTTVLKMKMGQIQYRFSANKEATTQRPEEIIIHCNVDNKPVEGVSVLEALLPTFPPNITGGHNGLV